MEFVYGIAVHNVALELRELQWQRFVDASGMQVDIEAGSKLVLEVRKAWELANPVSKYHAAARVKMTDDSSQKKIAGK